MGEEGKWSVCGVCPGWENLVVVEVVWPVERFESSGGSAIAGAVGACNGKRGREMGLVGMEVGMGREGKEDLFSHMGWYSQTCGDGGGGWREGGRWGEKGWKSGGWCDWYSGPQQVRWAVCGR